MEQECQNIPFTYSVESLLNKAAIVAQRKVSEKIEGFVRVKGVVSKVSRSPKYPAIMYLTLDDRDSSITVKCDSRQQVSENQSIIVEGCLFVKPSSFYSGLEVYIDGDIVGSWEIKDAALRKSSELKKVRYVSLADLLNEIDLSTILIVGTKIGITDAFSQLSADTTSEIQSSIIRVANRDSLIKDIHSAISKDVKAFVVVRGGDDKTMSVWDDPDVVSELLSFDIPFYTALGHSHSVTLADKFSDTAFHTPTAFGRAFNSILDHQLRIKNAEREAAALKAENYSLRKEEPISKESIGGNKLLKWIVIVVLYTFAVFEAAHYFSK